MGGFDLNGLHDVVLQPERWPQILHALGETVNAVGVCIAADHGSKTLIAMPVSPGLTDAINDFIESGWYKRDLRGSRAWPAFRDGRTELVEHDISTEEERRHTAYHNEWLRPWDLPWWGALAFSLEGQRYGLVALRNSQQGALTHEDLRPLIELRPHLVQALSLVELLSQERAISTLEAMDQLRKPAFLLNGAGKVVRFNHRARNLIETDFQLSHGVLRTRLAENNTGLQTLIQAAVRKDPPVASRWAALKRPGRKPLMVTVLQLRGGLLDIFTGARAILVVHDIEERQPLMEARVRGLFGLTAAEARVAIQLGSGKPLNEIADALSITSGTVRNHLKSIFAKTETRRQSDLLQILDRISQL